MKIHNFSAGPCILPQEVFEKSAAAVLNFNNSGLSILEISHRDKAFVDVFEQTRALVRELMELDDNYEVLLLQGGATLQFTMVAMNLMQEGLPPVYIDTGTWASGAIREAKKFGDVIIAASSKEDNYNHIPKNYTLPEKASYLHITTNNTIFGTQYHSYPEFNGIKVCDMSSDIFSRPVNFKHFDLIYAGAQKNMGPAGVTLVVVKKEILGKTGRNLPSYLDYQVHIDKEGMFNTPPVFSIYASLLTLQWLKNNGGLKAAGERNTAKAKLMYDEIDRNPLFKGHALPEDRSLMNATFTLTKPELEETFNNLWKSAGISGIKGHRSVGGYRASMYNALPLESVKVLVEVMQELERKA